MNIIAFWFQCHRWIPISLKIFFLQNVSKHIGCPTDDMNKLVTCLKVLIFFTFTFQFQYSFDYKILNPLHYFFWNKLSFISGGEDTPRDCFGTQPVCGESILHKIIFSSSVNFPIKQVLWAQPVSCSLPFASTYLLVICFFHNDHFISRNYLH